MTTDLEKILGTIAERKANRGQRIQPPCRPSELDKLRGDLWNAYRMNVPQSYEELLGRMNGIDFNGTLVFAASTVPHANRQGEFIEGLIDANKIRQVNAEYLVIFGESGMEMYVFDLRSQQWAVVDQVSLDVFEQCGDFDQLMVAALAKRL
jgi:hypothetical protein